jgi:biopolymer transport protein ExbB/TolQ
LVIGLIAYFAYSYLNTQIDKTSNKMEGAAAAISLMYYKSQPTNRLKNEV